MRRSSKRLLTLVASLPLLLMATGALYQLGMTELEETPRTFWNSLEWASETLSTTGYGRDTGWNHPLMVLFVMVAQFIGVFLVFLIFPIYLIPFLEERFEVRIPRRVAGVTDHIIIYRYGPAVENLLKVLAAERLPVVLLEADPNEARRLLNRGYRVLLEEEDEESLDAANLSGARALVANGEDHENAGVILRARQLGFKGEILAMAENPLHRRPTLLAGASAVYTPKHVLAAALAAQATERISARVAGVQQLGRELEVREVRICGDSPLAGKTLRESGIGARTGATVVGQWVGGTLTTPPKAEMILEPRGILVVVGSPANLGNLEGLLEGAQHLSHDGPFIIAGFGEVGSKVHQLMADVGEKLLVLDRNEREGVDLVGNVLDPELLESAKLREASGVVLALDSDDATIFATVIIRELAPEVPVIARVNQARNREKIYLAGADFALSLAQVAGQFLASRLVGQESVNLGAQMKLLKVSSHGLVGRHPTEARVRERTGCSVVAVERGDDVVVELDQEFRFQADDTVFLSGSEDGVRKFREVFPQDPA